MRGNMQAQRFCLVPLTYTVSGTERVLSDITRTLHARHIPVDVILPADKPLDRLEADLQPYTDQITRIGFVTGKAALGKNFLPALRFFRMRKPTLVHFHCPHHRWGLDVLLAARLAGVPYRIRTEHNPLMAPPTKPAGALLRVADSGMKAFTYVSEGNQRRFEHLLPYRVGRGHVIRNGIDPAIFNARSDQAAREQLRTTLGFPGNSKIAVSVGAYGGRRSLRTIFEAFQQLLAQSAELAQQWRLLIIGTGPQEEQELPAQLGIDSFIHFAGQRRDIAAILPLCDLFVTASSFEGMSIAMLEAWSAGLQVLSTRVDGISDIIGADEWQRLTADPGDVQGYVRNWREIMKGAPDISAIHRRASDYVRTQLKSTQMLEAYIQLYEQLLRC